MFFILGQNAVVVYHFLQGKGCAEVKLLERHQKYCVIESIAVGNLCKANEWPNYYRHYLIP